MSKIEIGAWLEKTLLQILNSSSNSISIDDIIDSVKHNDEFDTFKFNKISDDELKNLINQELKNRKKKRKFEEIQQKEENENKTNFKLTKIEIPIKVELKYMNDLKNAIKRKLDVYLFRYDENLKGVIISYKDIELIDELSNISYNPNDTHLQFSIRVNLLLFCPIPNSILSGIVNHIDHEFITLNVYGIFNARILTKRLKDKVNENDKIEFKILNCDKTFDSFIIINGTQQ
eukprot:gene9884-2206_t